MHARSENGGFIAACNDEVQGAGPGEHLVFLNNDTVPQPGWLDAVEALMLPEAGLVGAQLVCRMVSLRSGAVVLPMAVPGTTDAWMTRRAAQPGICVMPITSAVPPSPSRMHCLNNTGGFDTRYA